MGRFSRFAWLGVAALLLVSCDKGTDPSDLAPSPEPSPTPTPMAEMCKPRKVVLNLTVNGGQRFVWFLGEIGVFHAKPQFAGELVGDPSFDPSLCPEENFYRWKLSEQAAPGCRPQGPDDEATLRLDCGAPGGFIHVEACMAGYDDVCGGFDSEVKQGG